MKRSFSTLMIWSLAIATVIAQTSGSARFRFEKTADAAMTGPQRLDLDVDLLAGSQPFTVTRSGDRAIAMNGLGDLRLFADNTELPYLLIPPSADAPVYIGGRILPITAFNTKDSKSSGFELDLATAEPGSDVITTPFTDAIDIEGLPAPFLKRFRLEASGDRERWTELIREGTLFDLPDEGLRRTHVEFPVGYFHFFRITWDDTNSARLPLPSIVKVRRAASRLARPVLRAPVTVTRRPSEPGRSRFRLTVPGPRLPIVALELSVREGNLHRDARVFEPGLVGGSAQPRLLGQTQLRRVVRESIPADGLEIPIAPPSEPQLDLVIDDGDNPPLELTGVTAVFAELPWIYFEAHAGHPITARYGDPHLAPPRYDLEAARATVSAPPSRTTWRAQPPVALAVEPEGLPMPDTGSAISTDGFSYARDIPEGGEGLIAVPLDAAVMAHSAVSSQLRDLRVIDRSGMQIPYLLERRDEPLIVDVPLERKGLPEGIQTAASNTTTYAVHPPFGDLPDARLVLTTRARVFKRTATLGVVTKATDRQPARFSALAGKAWIHTDESVAAPAITFALPERLSGDLFLIVEEGDNQPLQIEKANILMPAYAVRLFRRPSLPLRMVYGNDKIGAPQYDLQLLGPQVLGRTAEEVAAGPERALTASGGDSSIELVSPVVFWAILGVAVVVLLGLVVRLMQREVA